MQFKIANSLKGINLLNNYRIYELKDFNIVVCVVLEIIFTRFNRHFLILFSKNLYDISVKFTLL